MVTTQQEPKTTEKQKVAQKPKTQAEKDKDDQAKAKQEHERLVRILAARAEVTKHTSIVATKKAQYDSAKSDLSAAESNMYEEIDDHNMRLPFADPPKDAAEDDWKKVSVNTLGLPGTTVQLLGASRLSTLGKLAEYCKNNQLTDVTGVGPATAEQIENALDAYWKNNPRKKDTKPDAKKGTNK